MDLVGYRAHLIRTLTPARLQHSIGVMQVMGELAEVYGFDSFTGCTAGLLHDAAKDLTPAEQAAHLAAAHISIRYECEQDFNLYLHGPLGEYIARTQLGVTDRAILDAIYTHTWTANDGEFDTPLNWCLRFADLLEPYRKWVNAPWLVANLSRLRGTVYRGRLDEAILLDSGLLVHWFDDAGYPVHPNMRRVYAEQQAKLGLDDSFLTQPC